MAPSRRQSIALAVSWLAWPGLFAICIAITGYGFTLGRPALLFNLAYVCLAVCLYALECVTPHELEWNENDGQTLVNIAHTLTSKGVIQAFVAIAAVIDLTTYVAPAQIGFGIWPRDWSMWLQVPLGIGAAEFSLYWAHRIAHEWKPLWRFHAVHHSVIRLWIVNTGRFHFVDSFKSIALGMGTLLALGAPMQVLTWLGAVTAFIGMLTHCNVEMRFGPLSWWFNTPELHRWHHSRDLREGDKNYGENLMLWDHLFGTYFNTRAYRPPRNIGIKESMPAGFLQQVAWPFRGARAETE
jgi:sterol desaturase/sphingolipid hydroxylase (fatty acid hydroxylase superfamily)